MTGLTLERQPQMMPMSSSRTITVEIAAPCPADHVSVCGDTGGDDCRGRTLHVVGFEEDCEVVHS